MTRYIHDEQRRRITLVALLFASFPELKAAFATDFATIRDFLLQYQQRTPGQPLLVAIGPDGTVLARTDDPAPPAAGRRDEWLDVVLAAPGEASIVDIGNRPSVGVAVALEAAGTVFGYLVAAQPIDQRFRAGGRRSHTGRHRRALGQRGSRHHVAQRPESLALACRLASLPAAAPRPPSRSASARRRISPVRCCSPSRPAVAVIVVRSRDEAFAPYQRMQRRLMLIALIVAAVAAVGRAPGAATRAARWRVAPQQARLSACNSLRDSPCRTCSCAGPPPRPFRRASAAAPVWRRFRL